MLVPLIFAAMSLGALHQTSLPLRASPAPTLGKAAPSAVPVATPVPLTTPVPETTPAPLPTVPPIPVPTPLVLPADAAPQIVDLRISSTILRSGDSVSGSVITSTNVASVEVRVAGYSIPVPRSDFGVFGMTYIVPHIPFFAKNVYTLQVIARNTRGDQAERDVQVDLR